MMVLNESKRDDLLLPYVEVMKNKGIKCTLGELKRFLLKYFVERGGFRNLSLGSNFYLAGVARYYFNGDLTVNRDLAIFTDDPFNNPDTWNEEICTRLNALIVVLRNHIIDSIGESFEQPEDFGEMTIQKLLKKYNKGINEVLGIKTAPKKKKEEEVLNRDNKVGNGYTFDILYSYGDARKYNKATEPGAWCITYGDNHYNNYIRMLNIHYVIFLKDGYESVPRQKGPDWTVRKPQDEYGCSMIAVLQSNRDGEPIYITSRWNHGQGWEDTRCEADHAFTKEEFFAKTGVTDEDLQRIFKIWKTDSQNARKGAASNAIDKEKKTSVLRFFKYIQMRINGGENPDNALIQIPAEITEPALKESYIASRRRVFVGNGKPNKSIISYRVSVNGEEYYILSDQGKLVLESIISRESVYNLMPYKYIGPEGTWENDYMKNLIIITLGRNKKMVYNTRFHKFLDIDGLKVFKHFEMFSRDYAGRHDNKQLFYEVKEANNKIALVDINTNIPLKLPNGRYWVERISADASSEGYGVKIRPRILSNLNQFLCLTYDSAAAEVYVFDIENRRFINVDVSMPSGSFRCSMVRRNPNVEEMIGEPVFTLALGDTWYGNSVTYNMNGERVTFNGKYDFRKVKKLKHDCYVVYLFGANSGTTVYSKKQESFLTDDDGNIMFFEDDVIPSLAGGSSYDPENVDIVYLQKPLNGRSGYYWESEDYYTYMVLMLSQGVFLQNPITDDYFFTLGFNGQYDIRRYNKDEQPEGQYMLGHLVPSNNPDAPNGKELKRIDARDLLPALTKPAFKPGTAQIVTIPKQRATNNDAVDAAEDPTINENFNITYNDIKLMVNEVIKKLQ